VKLNLEMITRDPLRVPCLAPKYWATMKEVPATALAEMLALVRRRKHPQALPTVSSLPPEEQLRVEADQIERCLRFASHQLV
jgi:hypothetical protein